LLNCKPVKEQLGLILGLITGLGDAHDVLRLTRFGNVNQVPKGREREDFGKGTRARHRFDRPAYV
jgi:hypothetical protein